MLVPVQYSVCSEHLEKLSSLRVFESQVKQKRRHFDGKTREFFYSNIAHVKFNQNDADLPRDHTKPLITSIILIENECIMTISHMILL